MFRPNIRGYPKSSLRPTVRGWTVSSQHNSSLVYRLPWRRSWVFELNQRANSIPVISRSGSVHLLIAEPGKKLRVLNRSSLLLLSASLIIVLVVFVQFLFDPPGNSRQEKPLAYGHSTSVSKEPTCKDALQNPKDFLASYSETSTASNLKIVLGEKIVIGGVRSGIMTVFCEGNSNRFRVTEALIDQTWSVTNLAQLEN